MKELGEKFSINEFLSYLCPGVCLLLSIALWLKPDLAGAFGEGLGGKEGIVAPFFLIAGYALGLIVAAWSGQGAFLYFALRARKPKGIQRLLLLLVGLLHRMPDQRPHTLSFRMSLVEANLRIADGLGRYAGFRNLSINLNPWETVASYRVLVVGRTGAAGAPIAAEADAIHARVMFALNMALVSGLVGFEALARIGLNHVPHGPYPLLPTVPTAVLRTLVVAGATASIGLRSVAARWRTREVLLTGALAPLIQKEDGLLV